jgi:hypothetical protein
MGADFLAGHHLPLVILGYAGLALVTLGTPAEAHAQAAVAIDSAVFVERIGDDSARVLAPARRLTRGDRVVYVLDWTRQAGEGGFVVTNPLPRSIAYQGSASSDEEVSADGGQTWGRLGTLRCGKRLALAEDVTHVRWRIAPLVAAKGSGRIAYSAIVR